MLTSSTPETVNPVADACEAAGVPCLSTGMPWEPWYFGRGAKPGEPSPFNWTYHFGFGVANFSKAYISQWNGPVKTNNRVAFLMPNDADGNALRTIFKPILEKAGFTVIDPGGYEDGTTDYAAQIAKFKSENCEIFTTGPIPPDFAVFWRQAAQQGYTRMVKIAQIAKTWLFPSQVEVAGFAGTETRHGGFLASNLPVQVVVDRSHLPAARRQVRKGYRQAVESNAGRQHGARSTRASRPSRAAKIQRTANVLAKALSTLKVMTPVGQLDWTKGPFPNIYPMVFAGTQWVTAKAGSKFKLDMVVTDNADDPNIPVGAKLVPYSG